MIVVRLEDDPTQEVADEIRDLVAGAARRRSGGVVHGPDVHIYAVADRPPFRARRGYTPRWTRGVVVARSTTNPRADRRG